MTDASLPLPAPVDAAADEVVRGAFEWRRLLDAGGAVSAKGREAQERALSSVERLVDALMAKVIEDPLDVRTAEQCRVELANAAEGTDRVRTVVQMMGMRRFATRVLEVGGRRIPGVVAVTAVAGLATSVATGVRELTVLASFVVHRLRAEGLPVDIGFVRQITLSAYTQPSRRPDLTHRMRLLHTKVLAMWLKRSLAESVPLIGPRIAAPQARRWTERVETADLRSLWAEHRARPTELR